MQPGVRRHDALLAMPEGMLVTDVNIVHALAVTYLQGTVAAGKSAEVDGAAAPMGKHNKEDEYCRDIDGLQMGAGSDVVRRQDGQGCHACHQQAGEHRC